MTRRFRLPREVAHAAKVAAAASLLVGVVYTACVMMLDHVVSSRLVSAVDARLYERMNDAREIGLRNASDDDDVDISPVYLWQAVPGGQAVSASAFAPVLPASLHLSLGTATTITLGGSPFRVMAGTVGDTRVVAGQSLVSADHLDSLLRVGEALAAPVLLLAMFAGALTIGLRALSPVEQSRRRQLEFTADASHELRTPLSVISAETSIALSSRRSAADYRDALIRIEGEGLRLSKIVDDLLWLARFDSAPPDPGKEPLDLATMAAQSAERFRALAHAQQLDLELVAPHGEAALVSAPPEWIDRLAGVLIDNACRHAGEHGVVRVTVGLRGPRATLTVEDSGPGIAADDRDRLFDRFHRSTEHGGSAGLGLAIADSIVSSTEGQWRLGDSELGGALFEVSWRKAGQRQALGSPPGDVVRRERQPQTTPQAGR